MSLSSARKTQACQGGDGWGVLYVDEVNKNTESWMIMLSLAIMVFSELLLSTVPGFIGHSLGNYRRLQ